MVYYLLYYTTGKGRVAMLCLKAHAKINWTLDIVGRREDGYHLMDMLMQTVDLYDTLWLEEAPALTLESVGQARESAYAGDALDASAVPFDERNLVYRAATLLQKSCGVSTGARIRLQKRIPSGAGMGGGSADAAAALVGLSRLWNLHLTKEQLLCLGLSLGADVPMVLTGGLAHVGGIGERVEPLFPAPEIWLVLLQPCPGLSTGQVFSAFDALPAESLARPRTQEARNALLRRDLPSLARAMNNVLEGVSVCVRPALRQAMDALEAHGALRAMMTGSGSVVYGLYDTQCEAENAASALRSAALQNGWGESIVTRTLAKNDLHS